MSNLIGRWKLIESKYSDILDYHEYLTAIGADHLKAKEILNHSIQLFSIHKNDNEWFIELEYLDSGVLIRNMKRFIEQETFDDSLFNGGGKCICKFSSQGSNKLVEEKLNPDNNQLLATITRETTGNILNETFTIGKIKSCRAYKKILD